MEARDRYICIVEPEASGRDENLGDNQGFEVRIIFGFLAVDVELAFVSWLVSCKVSRFET